MALLTKKEFAADCGMTTRELAVYIKRQKVLASDAGLIDDQNVINIEFRSMHADKKQTGGKRSRTAGKSPRSSRKEEAAPNPEVEKAKQAQTTELYELTKREKAAKIAAAEQEMQITQRRLDKMNGDLIPTDLVKMLFAQHFREVTQGFKQALDFLLLEIGSSTKANGNQVAIWRQKMVALLNESVNKSVEGSKNSIAGVVSEYQQAKKAA